MSFVPFLFTSLLVAGDVPRYRLEPGLELNYTATTTTKSDTKKDAVGAALAALQDLSAKVAGTIPPSAVNASSSETTTKWQVCVLDKNPDGSFRVLLFSQYGSNAPNARWDVRRADLFPDGRMINESEPANSFGPTVLPRLPEANEQEWSSSIERDGTQCRFKQTAPEKGMLRFSEERDGLMLAVYDAIATYEYTFDPAEGVIVAIKGARKKITGPEHVPYKHAGAGEITHKVELTAKTKHNAEWVKNLTTEAQLYFTLKEEGINAEATKGPVQAVQKKLEESNAKWKEAKSAFKHPCFASLAENSVKNAANYVRWATEDSQRQATMLGQPIPSWEAKDFEGRPYSSKLLKGKVVVLDFWYRGCGWCVRSMPQMNQLAADMKNEAVTILGVNIDKDPEDAKFVIRRAKLSYPNLEFHKASEKDKPHPLLACTFGYPTLLVIDREGKLADIHVGYSPTLRQEVGESIRRALRK